MMFCVLLGMGKTAVFVLSCLQQINTENPSQNPKVIVLAHTRELALQIHHEFARFSKHFQGVNTCAFFGGVPYEQDVQKLKEMKPVIVVGTPGRLLAMVRNKDINLSEVAHFVLDECDKMLEAAGL